MTSLDAIEAARRASEERLERRARELTVFEQRLVTDIDEARRLHRRHEAALEEVREKNHVLEQTINTLVASHKLLLERYDAEAAVEVRRRVAVASRE